MALLQILRQQAVQRLNASELNIPTNEVSNSAFSTALEVVYLVAGIVAVIAIIYAGFVYTTANGDSGRLAKAKNVILYTVVGLVIIGFAFLITQIVIGVF
ncbi:hypothetical protein FJZ39_04190 [Candidatus Saccharibacteria bacterium]|nr:hypothetical protein [Candidatus Saccharibacteria bacterium]